MNERIKKLKDQCWVERRWNNDMWIEKHIDLEKFAELIVRECMEVASPNYMSTPEDSVYYVEQAIDRIAEHFGVEG